MRSTKLIASPFCSSSLRCLMIGGRNAPSEGAPKMTIDRLSRARGGAGAGQRHRSRRRECEQCAFPSGHELPRFLFLDSAYRRKPFRQTTGHRRRLARRKARLVTIHFRGLKIADRERHVRTQHDPLRPDLVGQEAQHFAIVHQRIVVSAARLASGSPNLSRSSAWLRRRRPTTKGSAAPPMPTITLAFGNAGCGPNR